VSLADVRQLNIERAAGNVFHEFVEGPLTFRPTYKFQPKTSDYERRPDKKLRAPAWCDRILWHDKNQHIKQELYRRFASPPAVGRSEDARRHRRRRLISTEDLRISDHKPVSAVFTARIKTEMADKRTEVYKECIRELDRYENNSLPKVFLRAGSGLWPAKSGDASRCVVQLELDETRVNFGMVHYMVETSREVTISNISEVTPCLASKHSSAGACESSGRRRSSRPGVSRPS
jgi:hypothetical protein